MKEQLRTLAAKQGHDVRALVEDAIRLYLEAAAFTDLAAGDVAEAQAALLGELPHIPEWKPATREARRAVVGGASSTHG